MSLTTETGLVYPPDSFNTPADVRLTEQRQAVLAKDLETLADSIQVGNASPSVDIGPKAVAGRSLYIKDAKVWITATLTVTVSGPVDDLVFTFGPTA